MQSETATNAELESLRQQSEAWQETFNAIREVVPEYASIMPRGNAKQQAVNAVYYLAERLRVLSLKTPKTASVKETSTVGQASRTVEISVDDANMHLHPTHISVGNEGSFTIGGHYSKPGIVSVFPNNIPLGGWHTEEPVKGFKTDAQTTTDYLAQYKIEMEQNFNFMHHRIVHIESGRHSEWANSDEAAYLDNCVSLTWFHDPSFCTPQLCTRDASLVYFNFEKDGK